MPYIDRNSSTAFYLQLYEQIAEGIDAGIYAPGKKLPSIRQCAKELDVSNTTVELAYMRLTEEGYVQSKRGSGFYICEASKDRARAALSHSDDYLQNLDALVDASRTPNISAARYDFNYDAVNAETFPTTTWARICREVFFRAGAEKACLYNDRQGLYELREQIANLLKSEYGIKALPEQVMVMPTTRILLQNIMGLFGPSAHVGMEEPGYNEVAGALRHMRYDVHYIPVLEAQSWDKLKDHVNGCDLVFVTPSNQFPSNNVMSMDLRHSLLDWAEENGTYIIDDEYGCEFQSGISRMPSLGALDKTGRVITIGTFSNSFTPAVCLSYAVLPPDLMLKWVSNERGKHPLAPWQTQAAMATFMSEGHWRTHVRRIRTDVNKKRETLDAALKKHFGDRIDVVKGPGSLYVLVATRDGRSESELIEAARAADVQVYPTALYWSHDVPADWRYILLGYAGIALNDIEPGIAALAKAWGF